MNSNTYTSDRTDFLMPQFFDNTAEDVELPIKHKSNPYLMIPFPEGTTNGDIIKTLFPDIKSWISIEDNDTIFVNLKFKADWWDSPYKREGDAK